MSFTITIQPNGHVFEAEARESLLDAGLRAGLNLDHSCANGACGDCRARLIAGSVEPCGHADFSFSELDRQRGALLLCNNRPTSDVVIETNVTGKAEDIPAQLVRAKVSKIERLQDDVAQLTVRTPRSGGLHFLAGQSVGLNFNGIAAKTLPIASCPCDAVQLRFHLRLHDDPFNLFVFDQLRKGEEIVLQGPCGDFTLDEGSRRPLVFIAWETGFAPVSSLIDHAIQKDIDRSIDLYWLSAIPRGHYLSNHCRAWRDVLDDFRYHSIDLQPAGEERIDDVLERVIRVHSLLADHDYYLVLPEPALAHAQKLLQRADVPSDQVHSLLLQDP